MQPSHQNSSINAAEKSGGAPQRNDYTFFERVTLRYADNDANGHVNNAHYYSFFDTGVEGYLRQHNLREPLSANVRTLVVASSCRYYSEVSFPGNIDIAVRVARIGNSSIHYDIAIFRDDDSAQAAAQGTFTIVCASKETGRPVPVPQAFRDHLQQENQE